MESILASGKANVMKSNRLNAGFIQFLKFNAVGLLNTLIDFAVFTLLHSLGMMNAPAQVISYSAGTANSFFWNKKVTFRDRATNHRGSDRLQLVKFIILNLAVLGISVLLMHFLTGSFGIQVLIAKVLVTFVTVVINFFGSRMWVF
ncbi:putative flippase GtrA [Paenibacillus sp. PastF-1]|nr:putative flippase GtrA [Paenibacillus sp. PastF-2]MDF9851334.1 putative flippase GtrA [Paenibacillus sp. PastM-2]MDF9857916.1 putative flippase GtrA [Paenibacillus sp. PastF-1]MDH6483183.1 putative flippase GtrA [Paenibacillus sp. PastH-2]MDH6510561.1 putative flippase GtrA [Paenibacillus sp. PastM-3]